jgi:hypothetical protein
VKERSAVTILALLLLLLLSIFGVGTGNTEGTSEEQTCVAEVGGSERCSPATTNGEYQLPSSGTVVHALVNNGPLPPEYQDGYEITIDAAGRATVVVTAPGASDDLGDQRTLDPIRTTVDLGIDGLQQLLRDLDNAGFFFLRTRDEIDPADIPIGGDVSNLEVTLADRSWDVEGAGLQSDDRVRLDEAQRVLAVAVELDPAGSSE